MKPACAGFVLFGMTSCGEVPVSRRKRLAGGFVFWCRECFGRLVSARSDAMEDDKVAARDDAPELECRGGGVVQVETKIGSIEAAHW